MKTTAFLIVLILGMLSCRNAAAPSPTIENIVLKHVDIYPQYPGCEEFYEKEKQLSCLSRHFNNLIAHDIKNYYKADFQQLKDTLWVNFKIDTLGTTHYINIRYPSDSLPEKNKFAQIFQKIALRVPRMKPAIYHDQAVDFVFSVPVLYQTSTKNPEK